MKTPDSAPLREERWSPVEVHFFPAIEAKKIERDAYRHIGYLDQQEGLMNAAWIFMENKGFGLDKLLREFGIKMFVRHIEVDFLHELKPAPGSQGVSIRAETMVKIGDTSITFSQRLSDSFGQLACGGTMTVVATKDGKPVSVPDEFRKAVYGE